MTNTIAVPVELIEKIKERYPANSRLEGTPIKALVELLPKPVAVGDTLTVEQIKALPGRSVVVDKDGDIYVSNGEDAVRVTDYAQGGVRDRGRILTYSYAPYILLHIGKPGRGESIDNW